MSKKTFLFNFFQSSIGHSSIYSIIFFVLRISILIENSLSRQDVYKFLLYKYWNNCQVKNFSVSNSIFYYNYYIYDLRSFEYSVLNFSLLLFYYMEIKIWCTIKKWIMIFKWSKKKM